MPRFLLLIICVIGSATYANEPRIYQQKNDHKEGEKLIIANSKAWKPFSFIDSKGKPAGILIDYWQEFSKITGTPVEFLLLDWDDSLKAVADGRADFHAGLIWSQKRDAYLDFSQPILTIETHLFVSRKLLGIELDDLASGQHEFILGVVEGGFEQSYTQKNFPNIMTKSYRNNALLMESAFDGQIDAFVADLQVANFYLNTPKVPKLFTSTHSLYSGAIRPAVAAGDGETLLTLAKGINQISETDKHRIFNRWMYIETVYPSYLVPILISILVIAIISYVMMLRMAVRVKTRQLKKANRELKYLSETDQLTGLSNRYHFYQEFSQAVSMKGPMCVLLFDIDDFKSINDIYGHQVGDIVIQQVGLAIRSMPTKPHLFGRIGGEEFATVSANLSVDEALAYSESLCGAVRQLRLFDDERRITISLGCAYYMKSSDEISLSDADNLMYQAKRQGKNQVAMAQFDVNCVRLQPATR